MVIQLHKLCSGTDGAEVTAVPDPGYIFVNWSDAINDNPRTDIAVTANIDVTANFVVDPSTGIQSLSDASQIQIYPNPNNGQFTIACNNDYQGEVAISIYSVIGSKLRSYVIN